VGGKTEMKLRMLAALLLAAVATLAWAASAGAVDGTIEINQAKVMAAGGFPYVISNSGSYRLTSNLTVTSTSADAIGVNANHVTIDLNGFSIGGPGGSTSNGGINGASAGALTVENGSVTGFPGGYGIVTGKNGIVRNVQVDADYGGISGGAGSLITGNTANDSITDAGIYCSGSQCVISNNAANGNPHYGVYCGSTCQISGNTIDNNGNGGINAGAGSTISGNVANSNSTSPGILCNGNACAISNNTANSNSVDGIACSAECLISSNTADGNATGIACSGAGCLVTGNTVEGNNLGMSFADTTSGYGGNVLQSNTGGISGGTSLGAKNTNLCSGGTC
jgi:parallel beta-helix repeat protein